MKRVRIFYVVIANSLNIVNFLVIKSTEVIEICMMNEEIKTTLTHTDLFKSLVELIKRISPDLSSKLFESLEVLIRFLIILIKIPESINIVTDMELRKNEDYKNFRKDFLVILQSLFQISFLKDHIIKLISEKINLVKLKNEQITLYDVELVLYLCTNIDVTSNTSNFFFEIIINIPFYEYESETILLEYLESLVKFINCYVNNHQIVDSIAKLFISEKGLLYPNLKISSKISLILLKFIEKSRNNMDSNICLMMIDNVKKILNEITKTNNSKIINDFSSIYQSFGILINSLKTNNETFKKDCYIELFSVLLGYFGISVDFSSFTILNEGEKIELDKFIFVSKLLLNFLKSFNSEIKFDKLIFINFFKIFFFKVYKSIDMNKFNSQTVITIHTTIINILQKILILLTNDSLDIIEYFILNEFNNCSMDIFEQTIKLLINLTNLIKKDSYLMIERTLNILVLSVQNLGYPKTLVSDNEKMIISLYGHTTKLISNICNDFIEVIFESSLKNFNFIGFLINTSVNILDQNIKRTSFKCLKSMVTYLIKFSYDDYLLWSIKILDFSFSFISLLDLNNPIDISVSKFLFILDVWGDNGMSSNLL